MIPVVTRFHTILALNSLLNGVYSQLEWQNKIGMTPDQICRRSYTYSYGYMTLGKSLDLSGAQFLSLCNGKLQPLVSQILCRYVKFPKSLWVGTYSKYQ